jgi:uncharacterized protein YjiS (DUF1127 family)
MAPPAKVHLLATRRETMEITHEAVSGGRQTATGGSWLAGLGAQLAHIASKLAARQRRVRQLNQLYQFTDRELQDLGIGRGDFPAIMRGTYRDGESR